MLKKYVTEKNSTPANFWRDKKYATMLTNSRKPRPKGLTPRNRINISQSIKEKSFARLLTSLQIRIVEKPKQQK